MGEFELIARYFSWPCAGPGIVLGTGDDCALLRPTPGWDLAVSTDMLVAGRHFLKEGDAAALGHKALAVNLSDLAAMGARPLGFTLALALPAVDEPWLERFSGGLRRCAEAYGCPLVGGDTTRGPLTLSLTVLGEVPAGEGVRRQGARAGDDIWVSGTIGGAALALRARLDPSRPPVPSELERALDRPEPRLALGALLRPIAHAMIDVSDGLFGDLGHILAAARAGARIVVPDLPVPPALKAEDPQVLVECALSGGDDYELCFTAAPGARAQIVAAGRACATPVTRIGAVVEGPAAVALVDAVGNPFALPSGTRLSGYDHFSA